MALSMTTPSARAMAIPRHVCAACTLARRPRRSYMASAILLSAGESRLPRIATKSFWSSLVPRFWRRSADAGEAARRTKTKGAHAEERRTGLIFLFLGILVGSNAINIIATRRDMLNFTRQTDAKLDVLREVVQRVKNGEDVDVRKALGTGDPTQEQEWEHVIQELEDTDMLWEGRKRREAKRAQRAEERRLEEEDRRRLAESSPDTSSGGIDGSESRKPTSKFLM